MEQNEQPVVQGTLLPPEDLRPVATGKTFLFTCAQANTHINQSFWDNLLKLRAFYDAELHVSRFTYNKAGHGKRSVKPGSLSGTEGEDVWFDPQIEPYISDSDMQITNDLVWLGDLNILPTAANPLNGLDGHGRGASVVIPHVKMRMKSLPVLKGQDMKAIYSTGTVTMRNYIEKAAGQKASLHHVYGALLVEVDDDGTWWARQINADTAGTIYDLGVRVHRGEISPIKHRVDAITHGDLHGYKLDLELMPAVSRMLHSLNPYAQVFHDTIDFMPRNHHNIKDPHFVGKEQPTVEGEFSYVSEQLYRFFDVDSLWVFVESNHDNAVNVWLKNPAGFSDWQNNEYWLRQNLRLRTEENYSPFFNSLWEALRPSDLWTEVKFVKEDESYKRKGIEYGLHGHLGPNGARGSAMALRSLGKLNTAHTHSAGIFDGIYTAGVYGKLDMGYNRGPSSWNQSCVVTYANGKRAILTHKKGKFWR